MFVIPFLIVLLLDQISKLIAQGNDVTVVNTGISFSWLENISTELITVLTVVLGTYLALSCLHIWKQYKFFAGVLWGGVVSNLVDRLLLGGVTDWLTIPLLPIRNNVADVAITIGVVGVIISLLKDKHELRHYF